MPAKNGFPGLPSPSIGQMVEWAQRTGYGGPIPQIEATAGLLTPSYLAAQVAASMTGQTLQPIVEAAADPPPVVTAGVGGIVGTTAAAAISGGGAIAVITPVLTSLGLSSMIPVAAALAGAGLTVYSILQALGLGAGGGLFGINLLGGDTTVVNGIIMGGPGAAEPPAGMIAKEWSTGTARFYLLTDGRICCRKRNGVWRVWRPKRHIVLPRGTTTLSQAVKAQRYLDRLWSTVAKRTKALKLAKGH